MSREAITAQLENVLNAHLQVLWIWGSLVVVTVAMILLSVAPGVVFPWKVGVMGANSENLVSDLIPGTSNGFINAQFPVYPGLLR